ncbi:MAG: hypothetical protein JSS02_06390 [Planctomycetes bacterium]|nr:hypothetical protein [Planctomycetota bacterium]
MFALRAQHGYFPVTIGHGHRERLAAPASAHSGNDPDSSRYGNWTSSRSTFSVTAVAIEISPLLKGPRSMSEKSALQQRIHDRRIEQRLELARMIGDHPVGPDRTTAAEVFIREVMFDFAVGDISENERRKIMEMLAIAVPVIEGRSNDW